MDLKEIVNQQITLLSQLNDKLVAQGTLETGREMRENALAIAQLSAVVEHIELEEIKSRVKRLEDAILGASANEGLAIQIKGLTLLLGDHEERLILAENRIGEEDIWAFIEEDELPDYPHEETIIGLLERVKVLEGKTSTGMAVKAIQTGHTRQ